MTLQDSLAATAKKMGEAQLEAIERTLNGLILLGTLPSRLAVVIDRDDPLRRGVALDGEPTWWVRWVPHGLGFKLEEEWVNG